MRALLIIAALGSCACAAPAYAEGVEVKVQHTVVEWKDDQLPEYVPLPLPWSVPSAPAASQLNQGAAVHFISADADMTLDLGLVNARSSRLQDREWQSHMPMSLDEKRNPSFGFRFQIPLWW